MEDGEPEIDHDLDIDEFSNIEILVDYEEEDDCQSNVNTQQQKDRSLSGEKEKAEIPDGHIEHSNTDQNRNSLPLQVLRSTCESRLYDMTCFLLLFFSFISPC